MRMRIPRTPRRRRPTGTFQRLGLTRAQLQKLPRRQPTAAQKAKMVASLKAAGAAKAKARPTGTPAKLTATPARRPTAAQRAAMRKQAIAKYGNTAQRTKRQDAVMRRLERQGRISPGQRRSLKMSRQKFLQGKFRPRRTTKRTSRRLV